VKDSKAAGPKGPAAFACGGKVSEKNGAGEGTRTPDPIITNDVLYQLSYTGILLCAGLLAPPIRRV
jgi:hypothetical protein